MKRRQGIAALIAGTLILLGLLAVFAVELANNQSQSRTSLETQAHQRAVLVSGLLDAVFQQEASVGPVSRVEYGVPIVTDRELQPIRQNNAYVALLDSHGHVIAHSTGFSAQARVALASSPAIRAVIGGQAWALGDLHRDGRRSVVDLAAAVQTSMGLRIRVIGMPLSTISEFAASELQKVPGVTSQHQILIDGGDAVVGSTVADRPAGYVFNTPAQRKALSQTSGIAHGGNGVRYFDQVPLAHTSWKLLISVPVDQFFASVSGFRHWLPWIIFAAFGLVAFTALALVRRAIRASERLREANSQLITSNSDLNSAHFRLEESNSALARSNDELERQARELARSNTELDQFASIASHDLQEPLRKVRTFTERISETEAANLSERGVDYLRRANASAERMQTLIEDLLRFSRVTTQARPFAPVDLSAIVADVLDDLSEQVARTGAVVEVSSLPTINADASQMRQLTQNLISNAIKFRREDVSPRVTVDCALDAGWVTITVADNGIGFEPQYAVRIFRVFERLHGRGTYPGTGIGLALCRKIAVRHGGTVVADSAPGEGSTFTVTMQTQRTEAVSDAPPEPPSRGESATREEPYVTA